MTERAAGSEPLDGPDLPGWLAGDEPVPAGGRTAPGLGPGRGMPRLMDGQGDRLLDDAGAELPGWLAAVTRRLSSAGIVVVDRLPAGGDLPVVSFDGPAEDDDFVVLLRALGVKVVYAQVSAWGQPDLQELQARLRRARPAAAGQAGADLLAAAAEREGEPALAVLVAIAGGVEHRLCARPAWWRDLQADLAGVEGGEARAIPVSAGTAPGREVPAPAAAGAGRLAPGADLYERARDALDRLSERLHDDETFLATCTSEPLRRRYAQQVVKEMAGATQLPPDIRGAASAHAETVWQWWISRGRAAREAALRARLPELARDPTLIGGIEDRRRAARVLLQNLDPLAVTAELVDELARGR